MSGKGGFVPKNCLSALSEKTSACLGNAKGRGKHERAKTTKGSGNSRHAGIERYPGDGVQADLGTNESQGGAKAKTSSDLPGVVPTSKKPRKVPLRCMGKIRKTRVGGGMKNPSRTTKDWGGG